VPSSRQNNALLNSLAQKTSALKSVTIDIYDNAHNQETIDNTVGFDPCFWLPQPISPSTDDVYFQGEVFSSLSTNLRGSASRLTRAARQGDKIAVLKIAGICIGTSIAAWIVLGWIF
jgi:blocked early in transport 1